MKRVFACAVLALAGNALAAVGTLSAVDGEASVSSGGKAPAPAKKGSPLEIGDTVRVKSGAVRITLNDTSVILLAQGSDLEITEADFAGQERKSFAARLGLGTLWAKVAKALSGSSAKFEIETDRAVAGVRGTTFQIDVVETDGVRETHVAVTEGNVAVAQRAPADTGLRVGSGTGRKKPTGGGAAQAAVAPPAMAPAPPPPPPNMMIAAGQAMTVGASGMSQGAAMPMPATFDKMIRAMASEKGAEHRDEHRDDGHDRRRER